MGEFLELGSFWLATIVGQAGAGEVAAGWCVDATGVHSCKVAENLIL